MYERAKQQNQKIKQNRTKQCRYSHKAKHKALHKTVRFVQSIKAIYTCKQQHHTPTEQRVQQRFTRLSLPLSLSLLSPTRPQCSNHTNAHDVTNDTKLPIQRNNCCSPWQS